jgi:hypothetical protein
LQIESGAADDLQHVTGCSLLLKGFAEIAGPCLNLLAPVGRKVPVLVIARGMFSAGSNATTRVHRKRSSAALLIGA